MQGVRAGGRSRNRIGIGSRATGRSKSQNRGMAQFTLQMLPVSVKSFAGETPGTAERRSGTTSKRKATFWAESAFGTNWNLRLGKKLLCWVSYCFLHCGWEARQTNEFQAPSPYPSFCLQLCSPPNMDHLVKQAEVEGHHLEMANAARRRGRGDFNSVTASA